MISIVIPTLNEEYYIIPLLDSISKQTVDFEVIVVDAQSEDRTTDIVLEYCKKVDYNIKLLTSTMRGVAAQRNQGVSEASFDWILFLDADVVLTCDFLERAIEEIDRNSYQIAGTLIYSAESNWYFRLGYWLYSHLYLKCTRWFKPVLHGCSVFIKKDLHFRLGGFKSNILFEDFEYTQRASKYAYPHLLKSVKIRTSARRFYSISIREIMELIYGTYLSFTTRGIDNSQMKKYREKIGRHPLPDRSYGL